MGKWSRLGRNTGACLSYQRKLRILSEYSGFFFLLQNVSNYSGDFVPYLPITCPTDHSCEYRVFCNFHSNEYIQTTLVLNVYRIVYKQCNECESEIDWCNKLNYSPNISKKEKKSSINPKSQAIPHQNHTKYNLAPKICSRKWQK